ncbi:MAG: tRNA (adenosine(37)-N6)-threonylcarbamoyltransferase complex transferase subunit TsaD [Pseudomonadota bacterium]
MVDPNSPKPITVLGVESSCDETAAAVVRLEPCPFQAGAAGSDGAGPQSAGDPPAADDRGAQPAMRGTILSNIVHSQFERHAPYGGVVPEIAARAHIERIRPTLRTAVQSAGLAWTDIDAVAATAGPGLLGGLVVGLTAAKTTALALGVPFVAVNHLEGHALTVGLTDNVRPPYLLLLVSGGHTQLLSVHGPGQYERLGTTLDDALGEAFDKTAKLLGLPQPGGPAVEEAAALGNAGRFALPRPLAGRPGCDFSFAGLKTAVRQTAERVNAANGGLQRTDVCDLCASFQDAVVETVRDRVGHAFALHRRTLGTSARDAVLVVAGGVAANSALKAMLASVANAYSFRLVVPPPALCTDNAAMIAWAGGLRLLAHGADALTAPARARWPLGELSGDAGHPSGPAAAEARHPNAPVQP